MVVWAQSALEIMITLWVEMNALYVVGENINDIRITKHWIYNSNV